MLQYMVYPIKNSLRHWWGGNDVASYLNPTFYHIYGFEQKISEWIPLAINISRYIMFSSIALVRSLKQMVTLYRLSLFGPMSLFQLVKKQAEIKHRNLIYTTTQSKYEMHVVYYGYKYGLRVNLVYCRWNLLEVDIMIAFVYSLGILLNVLHSFIHTNILQIKPTFKLAIHPDNN